MIVYKELKSIEKEFGIPAKTLYGISNNIGKHYRTVYIPKRNGELRSLSVPDEILKRIQRQILEKLLSYEPISRYATGYKYGSSVQRNAARHVGKKKILKLDIENFFDSVFYSTVKEKAFPAVKYSENIRVLLSMLCYHKDALPQGAPTSPAITNIIMRDFDETVGDWCKERGITYSRYCDDMTFSSNLSDLSEVKHMVSEELSKMKFRLNEKKTAEIDNNKRQIVTGIIVNEKLNVDSDYKRRIRQEVYFCQKFGVKEHLRAIGSDMTEKEFLQSLLGKVSFVLQTKYEKAFDEYKRYIIEQLKNIK
jgi:retron-type reverse transcriptase